MKPSVSNRTRFVSIVSALGVASGIVLAISVPIGGCGLSSENKNDCTYNCADAEVEAAPIAETGPTPGGRCDEATDPQNPPQACGPSDDDDGTPVCHSTTEVATCPTDTPCMARVKPTGNVVAIRSGKFRLWAPKSLATIQTLVVDPEMDPTCFDNGADSFNLIMQFDLNANTVTAGGSHPSADGGTTYQFLSETVDSSDYKVANLCPNFQGKATSFALSPVTVPITNTGGVITSNQIPLINLPIFDPQNLTGAPIILAMRNAAVKEVTLSNDNQCVGSWQPTEACDSVTGGWTTGGTVTGLITLEDADAIPVKEANCQSLCAVLVADPTKIVNGSCIRDSSGNIPAIGDSCLAGTGNCGDSFTLSTTFAGYAVNVNPAPTAP